MKIHISEDSADILQRFGTFNIEPRGQIEIKGKGLMNTYWLSGKTAAMQQQLNLSLKNCLSPAAIGSRRF